MGNTLAAFLFALVMVGIVLELVRRKIFREKYAALWLIIGASALVLAGWPGLLPSVSKLLGIQVASNLLFALCIVLLLGVCLHLSWELSVVEDENRTLAEEVAILRSAVERIEDNLIGPGTQHQGTETPVPGGPNHAGVARPSSELPGSVNH